MKRSVAIFVSALALLVVGAGGTAHAQATSVWTELGQGCVPDDGAAGLFFHTGGSVKFAGGTQGSFTVACAVTSRYVAQNPDNLFVSYQDNDGTTSANPNVNAKLKRVTRSSGTVTTIIEFDSSDSGKGGNGTTTIQQQNIGFTHTFAYDTYFYFVVVTLTRNATDGSQISTLYGVGLSDAP